MHRLLKKTKQNKQTNKKTQKILLSPGLVLTLSPEGDDSEGERKQMRGWLTKAALHETTFPRARLTNIRSLVNKMYKH